MANCSVPTTTSLHASWIVGLFAHSAFVAGAVYVMEAPVDGVIVPPPAIISQVYVVGTQGGFSSCAMIVCCPFVAICCDVYPMDTLPAHESTDMSIASISSPPHHISIVGSLAHKGLVAGAVNTIWLLYSTASGS